MKKSLLFFFIVFLSSFFLFGCKKEKKVDTSYTVDDYAVKVVVDDENKYHIKEIISVNFLESKHGIYRYIPYTFNGKYTEIEVKSISVGGENEKYTEKTRNGSKELVIGSESYSRVGRFQYEINYVIKNGKDSIEDNDFFGLWVIPNSFTTSIKNYSYSVSFPNDFEVSDFVADMGNPIEEGNIYSGSGENLPAYQGIEITALLNDGAFDNAKAFNYWLISLICILAMFGICLITFIVWRKYGMDDYVIETPEFYPPDGLSSAEIAYLYNEKDENKGIISSIIDLDGKGYIEIKKFEVGKKKDIKVIFTKKKNYDGNNHVYADIMWYMFGKTKEVISGKDLARIIPNMKKDISKHLSAYDERIGDNRTKAFQKIISIVCFLPILALFITAGIIFMGKKGLFLGILFAILSASIYYIANLSKKKKIKILLFALVFLSFCGYFYIMIGSFVALKSLLLTLIIMTTLLIPIMVLIAVMPKLTDYGTKIIGKIRGFRNFLLYAKKEELELLANENPSYYFDVMGYAYALDISDEWIKKLDKKLEGVSELNIRINIESIYDSCSWVQEQVDNAISETKQKEKASYDSSPSHDDSSSSYDDDNYRSHSSSWSNESNSDSSNNSSPSRSSGGRSSGGGGGGSW